MVRSKVIGFLVAPLAGPAVIWAIYTSAFALRLGWFASASYRQVLQNVVLVAWVATPIAYACTIVLAIPAVLWFGRRGWAKAWHFGALGLLLGAVPFCLYDGYIAFAESWRRVLDDVPIALTWLALGAGCGGGCGVLFWIVSVRDVVAPLRTADGTRLTGRVPRSVE